MKKKIAWFFILTIFLLTDPCPAGQNFNVRKDKAQSPIEAPLKSFRVGEKLLYEVFWMGVPVGLGSLEIKEKVVIHNRPAFHVVAVAETNEFLSKLYPVHDEVHSYIDAEKFYSLEFRKTVSEGRYRADEHVIYDHEKETAVYESFKNQTKKEFSFPKGVQDFLSAFYWFRLQPIGIGQSVRTQVNDEQDNWDLEIRCLGRETKAFRKEKEVETLVIEPKTKLKGMLYDRGRVWVYFSVDQERVPLWFKVSTPFGPVIAVLRKKT